MENADFDVELDRVRGEIEKIASDAQTAIGQRPANDLPDNLSALSDRISNVR